MFRLKELRKGYKMSQQALATQLGVTQATLSGWENERYEIDNKSLVKCAEIFNVSVDYLLGKTDETKAPSTEAGEEGGTNIVTYCLDGKTVSKRLSDSDLAAIARMIEALPEDDNQDL